MSAALSAPPVSSKTELAIPYNSSASSSSEAAESASTNSRASRVAQLIYSNKELAAELVLHTDLKRLQEGKYQKLDPSISISEIYPEIPDDLAKTADTLKGWEVESERLASLCEADASDSAILRVHKALVWLLRQSLLIYPDNYIFIAKKEEAIQAVTRYKIREEENDLVIEDLISAPKNLTLKSVEQKERLGGTSTILITHCLAMAILSDCRGITLDASRCALSFYKNQGFKGESCKDLHLSVNDILDKLSQCLTEEEIARVSMSSVLYNSQNQAADLPNSQKGKEEEKITDIANSPVRDSAENQPPNSRKRKREEEEAASAFLLLDKF